MTDVYEISSESDSDETLFLSDESDDELNWESDDSRPPGPIPPPSTYASVQNIFAANILAARSSSPTFIDLADYQVDSNSDGVTVDYDETTFNNSSDVFTPLQNYNSMLRYLEGTTSSASNFTAQSSPHYSPRSPSHSPPHFVSHYSPRSPSQSPSHYSTQSPSRSPSGFLPRSPSTSPPPPPPPPPPYNPISPSRSPSRPLLHPPLPLEQVLIPDYNPSSPNCPPPQVSSSQSSAQAPASDSQSFSSLRNYLVLQPSHSTPSLLQNPDMDVQIIEVSNVGATVTIGDADDPHGDEQPHLLDNATHPQFSSTSTAGEMEQPILSVPCTKESVPVAKVQDKSQEKLDSSVHSETDDASLCTICMDPLTNSGKHRVVGLRCGHIFGQSCVERWIKVGCSNGAKRCPSCNKKATLKDIRVLYLPKVVPLDTVERDRLIQEKEAAIAQATTMEMKVSKYKLQYELGCKKYEERITILESQLKEALNTIKLLRQGKDVEPLDIDTNRNRVRVQLLHAVDISKEGGCRVLAYNHIQQELVVSQPSGNTLFAGFGVRVVNTVDFMPSRYLFLHSKMIRDLAFHAEDRGLLLSVSLDHMAKLVDFTNGTIVHTFKGDRPLWSCCWDKTNPHLLLLGSGQGNVTQYDRRMMDHYVNTWAQEDNHTPVVALASAPSFPGTAFPQGGFLSCRLTGVFTYINHGAKYRIRELPLREGPFMAMRYEHDNQCLLTMSRPSSRCPYTRVNMNLVDVDAEHNICLQQVHTFQSGSSARVLSRMTTVQTFDDSLVVAHHESGRAVNMWSTKSGGLVESIPIKEPVLDLTSITLSNNCLLASLSEKKVCIYKVT